MRRFGRGGTLINVRSGAMILSCAFGASLIASSTTLALSVEPVIDTVLSVAKLNESQDTTNRNTSRRSVKSEDKTSPAASPSNKTSDSTAPMSSTSDATSEPVVVVEPLDQLPSIDTSVAQPRTLYMYRPASTLTASPAVLGVAAIDAAAPLQASSHGWKVFGIAWYWWVIGGGFVYYAVQLVMHIKYRRTIRDNTMVN